MLREDLIISDPKVMMGKPTVVGTRVTVELILEKLAAGETVEQIVAEHPRLTEEGVDQPSTLQERAAELVPGTFTVVAPGSVRIRGSIG